jgi:protein-disulfide isomerase
MLTGLRVSPDAAVILGATSESVSRIRLFALVTVAAVAAGVSLVGVSAATSHVTAPVHAAAGQADQVRAAASTRALLAGIPQSGIALGRKDAPVTLVEFADLQCPYCGLWARDTLPVLVRKYVRAGTLRIEFSGLDFIGPDSATALRAAQAAGLSNRLWTVVELLYENQGTENTGWVTKPLLSQILDVAGLEPASVLQHLDDPRVQARIDAAQRESQTVGVPGTPFFTVGRTGGPQTPLQVRSLASPEFETAIAKALRS